MLLGEVGGVIKVWMVIPYAIIKQIVHPIDIGINIGLSHIKFHSIIEKNVATTRLV